MTADNVRQLLPFDKDTYGYYALKRWISAKTLLELCLEEHIDTIVSGYALACELFLKHRIARTITLTGTFWYSHNLCVLASIAKTSALFEYRVLMANFSRYYTGYCYEHIEPVIRSMLSEYFNNREVFCQADRLLTQLYNEAIAVSP